MAEDTGIHRVEQHGEAFLVTGGKRGEGETSYWVTAQTVAEARKEGGEKRVQELFRQGIDTSLHGMKERLA